MRSGGHITGGGLGPSPTGRRGSVSGGAMRAGVSARRGSVGGGRRGSSVGLDLADGGMGGSPTQDGGATAPARAAAHLHVVRRRRRASDGHGSRRRVFSVGHESPPALVATARCTWPGIPVNERHIPQNCRLATRRLAREFDDPADQGAGRAPPAADRRGHRFSRHGAGHKSLFLEFSAVVLRHGCTTAKSAG